MVMPLSEMGDLGGGSLLRKQCGHSVWDMLNLGGTFNKFINVWGSGRVSVGSFFTCVNGVGERLKDGKNSF